MKGILRALWRGIKGFLEALLGGTRDVLTADETLPLVLLVVFCGAVMLGLSRAFRR